MKYVNYEEDVVHQYGIELIGWTSEKWCNPSKLSSSLTVLRELAAALKSDECKFVKLKPAEVKARIAQHEADIAAGIISGKHRNPRSDIGKKRKRPAADDDDDDNEPDHEDRPAEDQPEDDSLPVQRPAATSTPYSVEEPDNDAPVPAPPAKRRKTAPKKPTATSTAGKARPPTASKKTTATKPRAKPATGRAQKENAGRRDDEVTRKALVDMKEAWALERLQKEKGPGSTAGKKFKSRAIISDDEDDDDTSPGSTSTPTTILSASNGASEAPATAATAINVPAAA